MGTDKVTAEYRKAQWTQVLRARRESGQTIKEFCEASYNVPIKQDKNSEKLSEPDIIKGRKLSRKKVHIK